MTSDQENVIESISVALGTRLVGQAARLDGHLQSMRTRGEVEDLHQSRVWSRRARTTLRTAGFLWHRSAGRVLLARLRHVTRSLGPVRDMDVIFRLVSVLLPADNRVQRVCRDLVRAQVMRERLRRQPALNNALAVTWALSFEEEARALVRERRRLTGAQMRRTLLDMTHANLDEVRRAVRHVRAERTIQRLHALRIAFKHLRYTSETLGSLQPGEWDRIVRTATRWQDRIGRLHDTHNVILAIDDTIAALERDDDSFYRRLQRTTGVDRRVAVVVLGRMARGLEERMRQSGQQLAGRVLGHFDTVVQKRWRRTVDRLVRKLVSGPPPVIVAKE